MMADSIEIIASKVGEDDPRITQIRFEIDKKMSNLLARVLTTCSRREICQIVGYQEWGRLFEELIRVAEMRIGTTARARYDVGV